MKRRTFLRRAGTGTAGIAALAGCSGDGGDGTSGGTTSGGTTGTSGTTGTRTTTAGAPSGTLTVATYSSFTGEGAAGTWLKAAFEEEYPDATVEFATPSNGVTRYVQRTKQGAPIDADLYVGLNAGELASADEQLDTQLFAPIEDRLSNADAVRDSLVIDPEGRAITYDTGYITLVYNEEEVENPGTFDALLEPAYEDALITENAQNSDPGRAFLLWTIHEKGTDGYLDYWRGLVDNGVTILSDWEPAYNAYMNDEAPIVVSYSTDQVYYHGEGVNMAKHQVGFLDDQGYANPEAMGVFSEAANPDLARAFVDFALTADAQTEIAARNVQFPAREGVTLPEDLQKYAYEPPQPVTFTYDELAGNVNAWIDDWARTVASK